MNTSGECFTGICLTPSTARAGAVAAMQVGFHHRFVPDGRLFLLMCCLSPERSGPAARDGKVLEERRGNH